jgi:predicted tellurium resistance membrane protein TerC
LARNAPNTLARRALMIGVLVALALTTAISLYGALVLALNAWPAVVVDHAITLLCAYATGSGLMNTTHTKPMTNTNSNSARFAVHESGPGPRLPRSSRPVWVRLPESTGRAYARQGGGRRGRV